MSYRRQIAALLFAVLGACFATNSSQLTEQKARTAVNLYAELVDPVYEVAMRGCIAREASIVGDDLDHRTSAELAQIEAELVKPSARCHALADAFELIRTLHTHAREHVEAGKYDDALRVVDEIRQAWRELRERTANDTAASHD